MSPRGLGNIPKAPEGDSGGGERGNFIRNTRILTDGEFCKIRFLTDVDEMYFEWQHSVRDAQGNFRGYKICPSSAFNQECDDCKSGNNSASLQFFGWVWEYNHTYTEPGDNRTSIKEGKRTVYREDVNAVRLFRYSNFHKASLEMRANKYGTLLDRDYEWIRSGEKGSKRPQYMLEPSDDGKEPMPKELVTIAAGLPDLEDVALGRVETLDVNKKDVPYGEEEKVITIPLDDDKEEELPF